MDKNKNVCGYPNERSLANQYLHNANLNIMNGYISMAKINLRYAKEFDAAAEDISVIEARIMKAETEINLKKAVDCLGWGDLYRTKEHLTAAKTSGVMTAEILEIERQLSITEQTMHYYRLAYDNVFKRDLENAKRHFEQLEEALDYATITAALSNQITLLKKKYQNLIESESFKDLAIDHLNRGSFSEALECLRLAKEHDLPYQVYSHIEDQIKGAKSVHETEIYIAEKNYAMAKFRLWDAELYKYPKEKINDLRKKLEDAQRKDKTYRNIERNKHDEEVYNAYNNAIRVDETQYFDGSSSASLDHAMEIDEDSTPQNNSSDDKITVYTDYPKQQALLKPIQNLHISHEAKEAYNEKHNAQNLPSSQVKYENSQNNMKKPPVPEKPQFDDKSVSKIASGHSAHIKVIKHSFEMATQTNIITPVVPEKPHLASKTNIDTNSQDTEVPDIKLKHSKTIEKKDENPGKTQKDNISLPDKCVFLVEKSLKEGQIENAEKIVQIATKLYPEFDFYYIQQLLCAVKDSLLSTQVTNEITTKPIEMTIKETKTNEVRGKQGNYAEYTMTHEEKDIPKVHASQHSMTTRGRSREEFKREQSVTTRGRSQEVRKPEYSLKTRERSVVRPNKKDESKINENNRENVKDDTKINANDYANKEKSKENPNSTANKQQAEYCLKCAKDALENDDIEKAERLAKKADRMHPSEECKTILAKVHQMKASSVKQQHINNGQNTNYSKGQIEDKEQAQVSLDIAFTAHAKGDIDKCRRFLRKAQKFDKSINIDGYMSDLDQKKKQQEDAEKAKLQEEQRKAAEKAKLQEEQRKAAEKAKLQEEKRKASEREKRASNESQNSRSSLTGILIGYGKKVVNTFIGSGDSTVTTKAANKDYSSYTDCVKNKQSSPEHERSSTNSSSSPRAQNKCDKDVQEAEGALEGAGAPEGASAHTDSETDQGAAKDNASGNGREPENERNRNLESKEKELDLKAKELELKTKELESKAKELENKACACIDAGDYKQALVLLDTALGIHPDKQHVQDLILQLKDVQENIEARNLREEKNQNEGKQSVVGNTVNPSTTQNVTRNNLNPSTTQNVPRNNVNPSTTQNVTRNNVNPSTTQNVPRNNVNPSTTQNSTPNISESSKGTNSYVQNMKHYNETVNTAETSCNQQQENTHRSRENTHKPKVYHNKNRGWGSNARDYETENISHQQYTQSSRERTHSSRGSFTANRGTGYKNDCRTENISNRSSKSSFDEAKYYRDIGAKAYHNKQYKEAEEYLMKSDDLFSDAEVRGLLCDARREKNREGSLS